MKRLLLVKVTAQYRQEEFTRIPLAVARKKYKNKVKKFSDALKLHTDEWKSTLKKQNCKTSVVGFNLVTKKTDNSVDLAISPQKIYII